MVVSSHRLATEAGLAVLRRGGSAADAFVATVLVQDVVLPGVTSTAGLTGILVYEARTAQVTYVHGGVADPIEPARRYARGDAAAGKLALVPGAPAAYAALVRRFGKKSLRELVEPAARLATGGFAIDALYARSILARRATLEGSAYGQNVFFHAGKPVAEGELLVLEELGKTLRAYGKDPTWFYKGPWAREAVLAANAEGGTLVARDFETYAPEIAAPLRAIAMGHEVYAAGYGGAKLIASLVALEDLRRGKRAEAPAASAEALARLLRVQRAVNELPMLGNRDLVSSGDAASASVVRGGMLAAARVWAEETVVPAAGGGGSHSSAAVVVDAEGNVVAGTHTIGTLNWGEGLFVGGVPLSTSAAVAFDDATLARTRVRIDALSDAIVLRGGTPRAALAVYGTGLHPADVQIVDAVLGRGLDAEAAVLEPRVGWFQFDHTTNKVDFARNAVDPRFDPKLLCAVKTLGFALERAMPGFPPAIVDTGFPTLVTIAPGAIHGMPPDPAHIHGLAAGD